jgi:hypothetical protein
VASIYTAESYVGKIEHLASQCPRNMEVCKHFRLHIEFDKSAPCCVLNYPYGVVDYTIAGDGGYPLRGTCKMCLANCSGFATRITLIRPTIRLADVLTKNSGISLDDTIIAV